MAIYGINEWLVQFLDSSGLPVDGKGLTTAVTIPNITQTFDSDQRSGYAGPVHFAKSLEFTGEASLTFKNITQQFRDAVNRSVKKTCSIQLNAAGEDQATGEVIAYELILRGLVGEFPTGGDFSAGDLAEFTMSFFPNRKSDQMGTSTFLYEPTTPSWVVNGVDYLAPIRTALGL